MDNQKQGFGLFNSYGKGDPGMNVPVTSSVMSPYMNFDPAYIQNSESQYIFPEGAKSKRGRFELAFSTIGSGVIGGGGWGLATGLKAGIQQTQGLQSAVGKTQLINVIVHHMGSSARTVGVAMLMYSGIGVVLSYARGTEDELNTVAAGSLAGFMYGSARGLMNRPGLLRAAKFGGFGFGATAAWVLFTRLDRVKQMAGIE